MGKNKILVGVILVTILVIILFVLGYKEISNFSKDTSTSHNLRLLSDSKGYKLLTPGEIFEVKVNVDSVSEETGAQITVDLPEGLELIEGSLTWDGTLTSGDNENTFTFKLKSEKEGFYQIKGYLFVENPRITAPNGIPDSFGACVNENIEIAKSLCENYIPKVNKQSSNPGTLVEIDN